MKRKEGQSFKDYKIERANENFRVKIFLQGEVFHNTFLVGTYNVGRNKTKKARRKKEN